MDKPARGISTDAAIDHAPPGRVSSASRILHLHIPKTAGTALRSAVVRGSNGGLRIFPHYEDRYFKSVDADAWDFLSGHFDYATAHRLGGRIITVLRDPVDRFVSIYYFWRRLLEREIEVNRRTKLTALFSLDDFARLHEETSLIEAGLNAMTWQIAHGASLARRRELRDEGKTDTDVLAMAVRNLHTFAVVGLQDEMPAFASALEKLLLIRIDIKRENSTWIRRPGDDIAPETRRRIERWVYLDLELYAAAQLVARQDR